MKVLLLMGFVFFYVFLAAISVSLPPNCLPCILSTVMRCCMDTCTEIYISFLYTLCPPVDYCKNYVRVLMQFFYILLEGTNSLKVLQPTSFVIPACDHMGANFHQYARSVLSREG